MLKLVIAKQFQDDLTSTYHTISDKPPYSSPNAARRLVKQVDTTLGRIQEFPHLSPISHHDNNTQLRCRRIANTNFRVVYTIKNNEIIVLSLIGKGYNLSGHFSDY